jgi:hypothetical protein
VFGHIEETLLKRLFHAFNIKALTYNWAMLADSVDRFTCPIS